MLHSSVKRNMIVVGDFWRVGIITPPTEVTDRYLWSILSKAARTARKRENADLETPKELPAKYCMWLLAAKQSKKGRNAISFPEVCWDALRIPLDINSTIEPTVKLDLLPVRHSLFLGLQKMRPHPFARRPARFFFSS